jgi:hypothetical protein
MPIGHLGAFGVGLLLTGWKIELGPATVLHQPRAAFNVHLKQTQQLKSLMTFLWKLIPGCALLKNVLEVKYDLLKK